MVSTALNWSSLELEKQSWQKTLPNAVIPGLPALGSAVEMVVDAILAKADYTTTQHAMLALHHVYVPKRESTAVEASTAEPGDDSKARCLSLIVHARALACAVFGYIRAGLAISLLRLGRRLMPLIRTANPDDGLGDPYYFAREDEDDDLKNSSAFPQRAMQWYLICTPDAAKPGNLAHVVSKIAAACNACGLSTGLAERQCVTQTHPGSVEAALHGTSEAVRAFQGPTESCREAMTELCHALALHADWQMRVGGGGGPLEDGRTKTYVNVQEAEFVNGLAAIATEVWQTGRSVDWGLAANTADLLRQTVPEVGIALRDVVADYLAALDPANVEGEASPDALADSEARLAEYAELAGITNLEPRWAVAARIFGNAEVAVTSDITADANANIIADAFGRMYNRRVLAQPSSPLNPYVERMNRALYRLFATADVQRHANVAAEPMWWSIATFLERDCPETRTLLQGASRWPAIRRTLERSDAEYRKLVSEIACDPRRYWMEKGEGFVDHPAVKSAIARLGAISDEAVGALKEMAELIKDAPRVVSVSETYLLTRRGIKPSQVEALMEASELRCDDTEYLQMAVDMALQKAEAELEGASRYEQTQLAANLPAPPSSYASGDGSMQRAKRPAKALSATGAGFCDKLQRGDVNLRDLKRRIGNRVVLGESTDAILRKLRLKVPDDPQNRTILRDGRDNLDPYKVALDDLRLANHQLQLYYTAKPDSSACQSKMSDFLGAFAGSDLPKLIREKGATVGRDPSDDLLQNFAKLFTEEVLAEQKEVFPPGVAIGDVSRECNLYTNAFTAALAGLVQEGLPMRMGKPPVRNLQAASLGYAVLLGNATLIYAVLRMSCAKLEEYAAIPGPDVNLSLRHRKMLKDVTEFKPHGRERVALCTEAKVAVNYFTDLYAESGFTGLFGHLPDLASSSREGFSAYELLGLAMRTSRSEYQVRRVILYLGAQLLPTGMISSAVNYVRSLLSTNAGTFGTAIVESIPKDVVRANVFKALSKLGNDGNKLAGVMSDDDGITLKLERFSTVVNAEFAKGDDAFGPKTSLNELWKDAVQSLADLLKSDDKGEEAAKKEARLAVAEYIRQFYEALGRYPKNSVMDPVPTSELESDTDYRIIDVDFDALVNQEVGKSLSSVTGNEAFTGTVNFAANASEVVSGKDASTGTVNIAENAMQTVLDVQQLELDKHIAAQFGNRADKDALRIGGNAAWNAGSYLLGMASNDVRMTIRNIATNVLATAMSPELFSRVPLLWVPSALMNVATNALFGKNNALARYARYKNEFMAKYGPRTTKDGTTEQLLEAAARAGLELCTFELPPAWDIRTYGQMLGSLLASTAVTALQSIVTVILVSSVTPVGYALAATVFSQIIALVSGRLQPYFMTAMARLFNLPPEVLLDRDFASTVTGRFFNTRQSKFSFSKRSFKIIQEAMLKAFNSFKPPAL
jgi:hypothetical protein